MAEAKWIRFIYSQDQIKEILDYCEEEKKEAYRHGFNDGQAEGLPEALKAERERVLPNDEELKALKHVVCFAIQHHLFDAERADNYYHKLKSLRSEP